MQQFKTDIAQALFFKFEQLCTFVTKVCMYTDLIYFQTNGHYLIQYPQSHFNKVNSKHLFTDCNLLVFLEK